jgi:hypothetical protein
VSQKAGFGQVRDEQDLLVYEREGSTHIKSVSKLTTTDEEKTALSPMLGTCSV